MVCPQCGSEYMDVLTFHEALDLTPVAAKCLRCNHEWAIQQGMINLGVPSDDLPDYMKPSGDGPTPRILNRDGKDITGDLIWLNMMRLPDPNDMENDTHE